MLDNLSNKEIARRLHMSERTAKFHVSNLLVKHGVRRRADLLFCALKNGGLPPAPRPNPRTVRGGLGRLNPTIFPINPRAPSP